MQIKCEYCGAFIEDTDEKCPNCGGVNGNLKRSTDGTPKTIEELKIWYKEKNLPPKETTRFFIGENYEGARAFGIYEENGEYIVYKNKDDGSRAVRYKGRDEAYAVNELYLKLKSEILNQKAHNINKTGNGGSNTKTSKFEDLIQTILGFLFIIAVVGGVISFIVTSIASVISVIKDAPYAGNYYKYGDDVYYCESYVDDDWYVYSYDDNDYLPAYIPEEMYNNINEYKYSDNEEWDSGIERFEDTSTGQYIQSLHESSSDDDYSWDSSDSWDSDSSDWGSDW